MKMLRLDLHVRSVADDRGSDAHFADEIGPASVALNCEGKWKSS